MSLTASASTVEVGQKVTVTATVTNNGPCLAAATYTESWSDSPTVVSTNSTGILHNCIPSATGAGCLVTSENPPEDGTLKVVLKPTTAGTLTVHGTVPQSDTDDSNNADSVSITVTGTSPSPSPTATPSPIPSGGIQTGGGGTAHRFPTVPVILGALALMAAGAALALRPVAKH